MCVDLHMVPHVNDKHSHAIGLRLRGTPGKYSREYSRVICTVALLTYLESKYPRGKPEYKHLRASVLALVFSVLASVLALAFTSSNL